MKKFFPLVLAIVAIVVFVLALRYKTPVSGPATYEGSGSTTNAMIVIDFPKPGDIIQSPLDASGKARGGWYFEASFPVKLLDENGEELAAGPAQAIGDWMTQDFVPFTVSLPFTVTKEQDGVLVLQNDNPSGLPENQQEVRIPVHLMPSDVDMMTVKAFFGNTKMQGDECTTVYPIERAVPKTAAVARASLNELLRGLNTMDLSRGYVTAIPQGATINSLSVVDGVAHVDFSQALQEGVAGSCRVSAIRAQIEATLKQFFTVENVVISIDGKTDDILQP